MAVSSKIEEVILEITRVAGNIYDANFSGIGSVDKPKTALFEINNLRNLAVYGYPYFGAILTDPLGFDIAYDDIEDQYNVLISSGQISYQNNLMIVPTQKIPIKKDFSKIYNETYDGADAYKYGITVGFPISEAKKSARVWETKTNQISSSGSNTVYVSDNTLASELGFPLEAHVGSLYLRFISFNANKTGLIIDPSFKIGSNYGTLSTSITIDTPVRFIFQPRLRYITGFPILTTNENPSSFNYYPPLPSDWIGIAKLLIKNPDDPIVAGIDKDAWIRTVEDLPTNTVTDPILGNSNDVSSILQSCSAAINDLTSLSKNLSVSSIIQALRLYTSKLSTTNSLRQFWSLQPFRPTSYYSKGLSFSGLEKFQFPYNFSRAYYNTTGEDLHHIFATFRGDLITYNSTLMAGNKISGTALTSSVIPCSNYVSSLDLGTQIYGASVVSNISLTEYGESVPTYTSKVSTDTTNSNYLVELKWVGTGISNPMFYHVYKKSNLASELTERRLTNIGEISYAPNNTIASVTDTSNYEINTEYTAFRIQALEDCFVGGITFKLGYINPSATIYNPTSVLSVGIYNSVVSNPDLSSPLSSISSLRYGDLVDGTSNEYTLKFRNGVNLSSGQRYWIIFQKTENLLVGTGTSEALYLRNINSGTYDLLSSTDGLVWSNQNKTGYFKLRGYLDDGNVTGELYRRGIQLTNRIAFTPQRLSVYVPPMENITSNTGLRFDGSTTGIAATTDTSIKNDLIITVTARNGESGIAKTVTATVPKGTARNTRFLLGSNNDLFDRVDDVVVSPGSNLTRSNNGPILWDIYDLVTIETVP